jgi:hypothetical protein
MLISFLMHIVTKFFYLNFMWVNSPIRRRKKNDFNLILWEKIVRMITSTKIFNNIYKREFSLILHKTNLVYYPSSVGSITRISYCVIRSESIPFSIFLDVWKWYFKPKFDWCSISSALEHAHQPWSMKHVRIKIHVFAHYICTIYKNEIGPKHMINV